MSPNNNIPTETSPLLPEDINNNTTNVVAQSIESSAGVASESPKPDGQADDQQDGSTLERQETQQGRLQQYQGMPELMKRMKYMFPALAIGVFLSAADQTLVVSSYGKIGTELDALNKTSWIATA